MVKIEIVLPDGRTIKAQIRERQYRKLETRIEKMSFWQKLRLLFSRKDK